MTSIRKLPAITLAFTTLSSAAATAPPAGSSSIRLHLQGKAAHRWVEVVPAGLGSSPSKVVQAEDGAASVAVPDLAPGAFLLCAGGEGAATDCERVVVDAGTQSISLRGPVPGVRVTGRFLVGKAPLPGLWFGIVPSHLDLRRSFAVPLERKREQMVRAVHCDDQGRFAVPLLAPGEYFLDIHSPGGRIDRGDPFTVPPPEKLISKGKKAPPGPPVFDLGERVLEEGVRVEVSVTDAAGQPVAKAGVGAGQVRPGGDRTFFEAYTGSGGAVVLSRVDSALPLDVTCVAPGYVRQEQHFDSVPALVRCSLSALAKIRGRVVDADDKPIAGVTVSLSPEGGSAKTPENGEFSFAGLAPATYRLRAAAPGRRAVTRHLEVGAAETKVETLHLEPSETLSGRVVDGATKKPVERAVVRVVDPVGFASTETDDEGAFALRAGADEPLSLEVEASGYPVTPVPVSREQQASTEPLRIELFPGGRIRAEVWDEEADAPCAACRVGIQGGRWMEPMTTTADGSALSPLVPPGTYYVSVERAQSLGSLVTVRGGDDNRSVRVEPNQTATVRIGEPRQSFKVAFSPPLPPGWNLEVTAGDRQLSVELAADGTFLARRPRGTEATLSLYPVNTMGMSVRQAVVPADFAAPVLTLPLSTGAVTGNLQRGDQAAAVEPMLLVSAIDGTMVAKANTDDQGSFSIPFVPPGTYSLIAGRQPLKVFTVGREPTNLGTVALHDRK